MLLAAAKAGSSDLHLSTDAIPLMRLHGELMPLSRDAQPLAGDWVDATFGLLMGPIKLAEFEQDGETDLAYALSDGQRVRVNVFRQHGGVAAAIRLVPTHIPELDDLGVPAVAGQLALRPHGLVLVTGPTGAGKSTTLAAMIDLVNRQRAGHIVTVEDPIEYLHESNKCLVHQREIGADAPSFASALRHLLREDPDVIMIGELRDPESISVALTAAETGHLVLGTMHTQGAAKTIDRIIDSVPASHQGQVRAQLGDTLQGVISQLLLPRAGGGRRVLATEVLVHTRAVANLIRGSQGSQLPTVMQTSSELGMHTLDQSLHSLVASGLVESAVAAPHLADRGELAFGSADHLSPARDMPTQTAPRGGSGQ